MQVSRRFENPDKEHEVCIAQSLHLKVELGPSLTLKFQKRGGGQDFDWERLDKQNQTICHLEQEFDSFKSIEPMLYVH